RAERREDRTRKGGVAVECVRAKVRRGEYMQLPLTSEEQRCLAVHRHVCLGANHRCSITPQECGIATVKVFDARGDGDLWRSFRVVAGEYPMHRGGMITEDPSESPVVLEEPDRRALAVFARVASSERRCLRAELELTIAHAVGKHLIVDLKD